MLIGYRFEHKGLPSSGAGKAPELDHGKQEGSKEQVRYEIAPLGTQVQGAAEAVLCRRDGALGGLPDGVQPRRGQTLPQHAEGPDRRDPWGREPLRRRGRGRREPLRRKARGGVSMVLSTTATRVFQHGPSGRRAPSRLPGCPR